MTVMKICPYCGAYESISYWESNEFETKLDVLKVSIYKKRILPKCTKCNRVIRQEIEKVNV